MPFITPILDRVCKPNSFCGVNYKITNEKALNRAEIYERFYHTEEVVVK